MQDTNNACILQGNGEINVACRVFLGTKEITLSRRRSEFRLDEAVR